MGKRPAFAVDEVDRVIELLSKLKGLYDSDPVPGMEKLTLSDMYLASEAIDLPRGAEAIEEELEWLVRPMLPALRVLLFAIGFCDRELGNLERASFPMRNTLVNKPALLADAVHTMRLVRAAVARQETPQARTAVQRSTESTQETTKDQKTLAEPEKRSWTQDDLDNAIRKYKADRASRYSELFEVVKEGNKKQKKKARTAAQKLFGRNVIAKELRVKSRSMVSKSPAWEAIAEEFGFTLNRRRATGTRRTQKAGKIGLDIAVEQASVDSATRSGSAPAAEDSLSQEESEETLREIRRLAESGKKDAKKNAKGLLEKYQRGKMTDEEVRSTVAVLYPPDE